MGDIFINTKVEQHKKDGVVYYVKREDLCNPSPAPPFAKVRGLYLFLQKLKQRGVTTVGYMDTAISMAGWGISCYAKKLSMQAVIFYPAYKDGYKYNQEEYIPYWEQFGATIIPLKTPTQHQININRAKRQFAFKYPDGVWLPNGLKFEETIEAIKIETEYTLTQIQPKSIVCCVGSGVMLAGIIKGLHSAEFKVESLYGILVDKGANIEKKKRQVLSLAGLIEQTQYPEFFPRPDITSITDGFEIIPTKYLYKENPQIESPFPCNPYYDLKAYEWMLDNLKNLKPPILFWNIGA